jgi:hypothetical protein
MFEIADGSVVDHRGRVVDDRGIGSAVSTAERVALALAAILAVVGVLAIARTRSATGPGRAGRRIPVGPLFLWLVPILMIATALPIAGLPRYRLPADPFLLILAAIGVVWLRDHLTARRPGMP